jgi:hypothetical protein
LRTANKFGKISCDKYILADLHLAGHPLPTPDLPDRMKTTLVHSESDRSSSVVINFLQIIPAIYEYLSSAKPETPDKSLSDTIALNAFEGLM